MDLNSQYSEYQKAIMLASGLPHGLDRDAHLANAADIADRIERFQLQLGAAAACAWSALKLGQNTDIEFKPTGQDL